MEVIALYQPTLGEVFQALFSDQFYLHVIDRIRFHWFRMFTSLGVKDPSNETAFTDALRHELLVIFKSARILKKTLECIYFCGFFTQESLFVTVKDYAHRYEAGSSCLGITRINKTWKWRIYHTPLYLAGRWLDNNIHASTTDDHPDLRGFASHSVRVITCDLTEDLLLESAPGKCIPVNVILDKGEYWENCIPFEEYKHIEQLYPYKKKSLVAFQ